MIRKLTDKISLLNKEIHKYDDRIRLPRTVYYSNARNTILSYKKISACQTALKILENIPFTKVEIERLYITCFPDCDKNPGLERIFRTEPINLHSLYSVIELIVNKYLPLYKKNILNHSIKLSRENRIIEINPSHINYGYRIEE